MWRVTSKNHRCPPTSLVTSHLSLATVPLAPEQVAHDEKQIRRPFRQPPHEISIPLRPIRNIQADAPSLLDQRPLQAPPDAVEHLEFEAVCGNIVLAREGLGGRNDGVVVRG